MTPCMFFFQTSAVMDGIQGIITSLICLLSVNLPKVSYTICLSVVQEKDEVKEPNVLTSCVFALTA